MTERLIGQAASWQEMREAFVWPKPAVFNIADAACERWAQTVPDRLALTYLQADGQTQDYSYGQLNRAANQLANVLKARGVGRGDRVAVLLPQMPETVLTHLAAYKLGAIAVPLFTLFGEDGLKYRLVDSGAKALVTDHANLPKVQAIRDMLPDMSEVFSVDGEEVGVHSFWCELEKAADHCSTAVTGLDDPAFISYTSGTTGPPKGALHGHRVLLGHLPGVELHHNFLPQQGDRIWTPADWAWMGGLANVLLPALYFGVPVIAHRMAKFDPDHAWWLMDKLNVRNTFLPPTALKLMRQAGRPKYQPKLRSVGSGGEALGAGLLDWGREHLGTTINEFYGQTECNLILSNSQSVLPVRAGSTGKAVPGHDLAVIDAEGQILEPGQPGEIAVRRPDPVMFLEYWNQPEKTAEKFVGDWMRTGDEGFVDDEGYFHFASRSDDVITSSGYRIGPSEIEDCLCTHPDVAMAGVIGVPDPVRTEAVKAFVVLRPGAVLDRDALIGLVRSRLSPHLAPREVEAIEALPMTATGKIMRRALKDR